MTLRTIIDDIQGKSPSELTAELAELLSYDKVNDRWFLEHDSIEYTYNSILERWIPTESDGENKKRSADDFADDDDVESDKPDSKQEIMRLKKMKLQKLKEDKDSKKQTKEIASVYISNIPLDTSVDDLQSYFQKFGVIAEDLTSSQGSKRIKMYTDDAGNFKGDALITYLRPESCKLAIELANQTKLRYTDEKEILVSLADFSHRASGSSDRKSDFEGKDKPKMKIDFKDKAVQKRIKKMNHKLEDWEDDSVVKSYQSDEKTVVIKNCFTIQELKDDPTAELDIKDDIREGCEELGEVTNVVLYDLEPEGIITVRFASPVAANLCITSMNGRYFSGQKLEVFKYDGFTKYQKTKKEDGGSASAEKEQERLEKFGQWIES